MAIGLALARCAVLVFFIRTFFTKMYPWLRRTAYLCIFLSIVICLVTVLGTVLHCLPAVHSFSVPYEDPQHCFALKPFVVVLAAIEVALDGLIWTLPHFVIWNLQLQTPHKLTISIIFALGSLTTIIGCLRLWALTYAEYRGNVTIGIGTTLMWAVAQVSIGISVACFPHLRSVFEKITSCGCAGSSITSISRPQSPRRLRGPGPQSSDASIKVTTIIELRGPSFIPEPATAIFGDAYHEPWAPTVRIERGSASSSKGKDSQHAQCSCFSA
ncbi:hypothetical protein IQ07DRAFT_644446 [Pyrenochaeta sp. DS3sAY3a]|nr:hypothetical protein IQ07DRAFT_644446 [Pyrenochaeta sp. DS3sAY3a]